jgi:hypothetical protein
MSGGKYGCCSVDLALALDRFGLVNAKVINLHVVSIELYLSAE